VEVARITVLVICGPTSMAVRSMNPYPLAEAKGIQTALDALLTPKARGARAERFMDTNLMEEIEKNGFIDRLTVKRANFRRVF
jgi:hypothetical protein